MSHVYTCVTESKQETQQIAAYCCREKTMCGDVWGKAMMRPGQNSKTVSACEPLSSRKAKVSSLRNCLEHLEHLSILIRKLCQPAFVCPNNLL